MSDPTPITQTPEQKKETEQSGTMVPLDIPIIPCAICSTLKTATGATIADLHRLDMKQPTGPAAGNPAGTWSRVVLPVYCCLDCTIELKLSDAECLKMVEAEQGPPPEMVPDGQGGVISLAEQHERELAEAQQSEQEVPDGQQA